MSKRVVIVGGGIVGLCAAYYCRQKGHQVTVIEREPKQGDGCSIGNAGMIVPSHFIPLAAPGMMWLGLKWMANPESPFYVRPRFSLDLFRWGWEFWRASTPARVERAAPLLRDLHFASRACYEELDLRFDHAFGLAKRGLLMLCKSQKSLDEEAHVATQANRLGVPAEVLDAARLRTLDPNITMSVEGGVYFPRDCHLSPQDFLNFLQRHLQEAGVEFRYQLPITKFEIRERRVVQVRTATECFEADEVILAAGFWSTELGSSLGLRLPMQAGKGYSLTLTQPRELPSICSILTEARVAVTPMGASLRFGGTMELGGTHGTISPRRVQGIIQAIPAYYPSFRPSDFEGVQPWHGLRPCSPDGLPFLGRTRKFENLVIATGHAMMGISLGPITGKIVAQIIAGEPAGLDLSLVNPDRFS